MFYPMPMSPEDRQKNRDANFALRPTTPTITVEQRVARGRKLRAHGRGIASPALRGKKSK